MHSMLCRAIEAAFVAATEGISEYRDVGRHHVGLAPGGDITTEEIEEETGWGEVVLDEGQGTGFGRFEGGVDDHEDDFVGHCKVQRSDVSIAIRNKYETARNSQN